ncbi:carbamoyltransferase HypF [Luedemannella helvata]|uniref:Carbamoyltransferase n=1 Tax=Luedemannella helvata TaxID=349315 RepID=A0ABP4WTI9_9ACTN
MVDEDWSITVRGTVQGVGYRPFVYRVAKELGVRGWVRNTGGDVLLRAVGPVGALRALTTALRGQAPALADVRELTVAATPAGQQPPSAFVVLDSGPPPAPGPGGSGGLGCLPPDIATCEDCLRELFDPGDRRYRYPFITCTNCGPRATIVDALPYDRARTAMAGFALCGACAAEYADPADRRFHAETVACADCGPRLSWSTDGRGGEAALAAAVATIAGGGIVAVKGLGGYQLVCDALATEVVDRLRERKHRARKPFAVMVADLAAARVLARLTPADEDLLTGTARPVVLVPARPGNGLAGGVHPGTAQLGLFLPTTALHHLLLRAVGGPVVATSGNRADEPIVTDDADAAARLTGVADGLLGHDRPIRARYDDSVARTVAGAPTLVRRARGYAPQPLDLPVPARSTIVAVGAQLKHTFTLASGRGALVGPHGGSLDDADALAAFTDSLTALCRLHDLVPRVVAHDLHPGYLSTRYAARWTVSERMPVQHHHAHVVSCAAEHGLDGPFLGVAYDGLGLGDDGTLWGGELLLATYTGYRRLARFGRAPLPGGAAAVRRPARMALGYLAGGEFPVDALTAPFVDRLDPAEVAVVRRMVARGVNCPVASSAGRLFDAVSSLLGICDHAGYEGEAAVMLESAAATCGTAASALPWRIATADGLWIYDWSPTVSAVLGATGRVPVADLAAAFHRTIVEVTVELCVRAAERTKVARVCLSGGCLANQILAAGLTGALADAGLVAYLNHAVPAGDGGISYGQAAVAAARQAGEE